MINVLARHWDDADAFRAELGLSRAVPNTSTLGRLLARLDGDALDDALGTWLTRHVTDPVTDRTAAVQRLSAALHGSQTVIAQRQIAAESNEIPALAASCAGAR